MTKIKAVEQLTNDNIQLISKLDKESESKKSFSDHIVDAITLFCGSMMCIYVHLAWFVVWMSVGILHLAKFDPYPFNLLTLAVSLESIFLSTFILISQNKQSRLSERRAHLDLQINLLSEQENTKMLIMLNNIQKKLDIECDEESLVLANKTQPELIIGQIDETL